MDARELLRRYLEQRRELGETELVLDGLSVDEVLAIVTGGGRREAGVAARDEGRGTRDESRARPAPAATERASEPPRDRELPETADWRQALRAAGAAPGAASAPADLKPGTPAEDASGEQPNASRLPSAASGGIDASPVPRPASPEELFQGPTTELQSLDEIVRAVASCTRCPLYSTALNPVPGEGNPNADFMCVGEAPGATEDETGRPFVGQAGQLLTKILAAIDLKREDVFICNVLKHRPPGNRNPLPDEVKACSPYLIRQIELVRPKVILALGSFAAQTLLETKLSIGKLRGQIHQYRGVPLVVTYHPAALLRNPAWKRPTWEDVQLARRILDSARPCA